MSSRLVLLITTFLFLVPSSLSAQTVANAPIENKLDPAIEKKAFDLVEGIADQISNLHAPANRISTECAIADLLWTHDEKRARALFKAVTDEMVSRISELDLSDGQQIDQELSWLQQQRQEVVNRMAEHDPDLALAFLRQTRLQAPESRRWYSENETNLELQLAQRIAAKDPARALELARASLSRGLSWNINGFLSTLQQKDPKTAQVFYGELVSRIKSETLEPGRPVFGLAMGLLSSFQPPQASEDTYRDLISTMVTAGLNVNPASQSSLSLVDQLKSLMPQIEKFAPERAGDVKQWSTAAERLSDPTARMYREMSQLGQTGSVDEMLAAAPRYLPEFQNQLYQQAAWKAFSSGDVARARQIVSDFVSDPVQKRQILEQFDNDGVNKAFNENKLDLARQLVNKVKSLDQRVQMSLRVANQMAAKGDKKGALDLLNELRSFLAGLPQNSFRMSVELQLASSYSSLDIDQSFAVIEPMMARANELMAAAVLLDGFDQRYLRDDEWTVNAGSNLNNVIINLENTLAGLAAKDFDRARALGDRFDRPEIRLMTQLRIAESVLGRKSAFNYWMGGGRRMISFDE
jgi:hypothetical protein